MSNYVLYKRIPKDEAASSNKILWCMMTLIVKFPFQSKYKYKNEEE